ncbi:MAG: PrsW family intramembrane metalloprotease [Oscillospiraceae bacterium]|jgi:RsiW-degrading membrane proteinase PrsW (M82 family)|nr:PrsW family intramembrane metalloprotease [Oscillospiraceae bacterium]
MGELNFQFLSAFIAMTIPLLFVAVMLGKGDNRRIILYFRWGLFAGVLAYNLNNLLNSGWEQTERIPLTIAPMMEEICKGLPVLLFLNRKKYPALTKVVILCAMASGVGFSIQESMYYFAMSGRAVPDILALVVRTLTTALMHGMTTAAFGIGLLVTQKQRSMRLPLIFGLFAACASVHALFNLLLTTQLAWLAAIMPIAMFFGGWVFVRKIQDK